MELRRVVAPVWVVVRATRRRAPAATRHDDADSWHESLDSSREGVSSWREDVASWRESVPSWREGVPSWPEGVPSRHDHAASWHESPEAWRDHAESWRKSAETMNARAPIALLMGPSENGHKSRRNCARARTRAGGIRAACRIVVREVAEELGHVRSCGGLPERTDLAEPRSVARVGATSLVSLVPSAPTRNHSPSL